LSLGQRANMANQVRIESLAKDNYDSWCMQVEALMTKNDSWKYASGEVKQPVVIEGDVQSENALKTWLNKDKMAKSDLILSISPNELQQIRGCVTSREIWLKLESIYASKGPARKATLLKQLTLQRLQEGQDVREHLLKFFDAVDKLKVMGVLINEDLLSIMLLYSLPASYENFRCAMESHEKLPNAETLKVKIIEESEARMQKNNNDIDAMIVWKRKKKKKYTPMKDRKDKDESEKRESNAKREIRCYKCQKLGHKANSCFKNKEDREEKAAAVQDVFHVTHVKQNEVLHVDTKNDKIGWCLDSGCTAHICNDKDMFTETIDENNGRLNLASNDTASITGRGNVNMVVNNGTNNRKITLEDTLLAPDVRMNLLSVSKITNRNYEVIFKKDMAIIQDRQRKTKMIADRIGDLYYIREADAAANTVGEMSTQDFNLWHQRLGHVNKRSLSEMVKRQIVKGISIRPGDVNTPCEICIQGKQTKTQFRETHCKSKNKLKIVHTDLCGPMRTTSKGGAKYFLSFIDDCTRWTEVFFLRQKSDALQFFQEYKSRVERFTGEKIKYLQSDNGREFCNEAFDSFLKMHGIQRRLTVPYTPEQNGVAERMNRTLIEMARCVLFQGKLDNSFWAEAVHSACYLRNRCASRSLNGRTPYEMWNDMKPQLGHLRTIGTEVYVLDKALGKGKFDVRGEKGVLVGYSEQIKGYRVWIPTRRNIIVSRDVRFLEEIVNTSKNDSPNKLVVEIENTEENKNPEMESDLRDNDITFPSTLNPGPESNIPENECHRAPGRPRMLRTGSRGRPRKQYQTRSTSNVSSHSCNEVHDPREEQYTPRQTEAESQVYQEENDEVFYEANIVQAFSSTMEVPLSDALNGVYSKEWKDAMVDEVENILRRNAWKIIDRPAKRTVVGSRFVLTNKLRPDGSRDRKKVRLVAKGFSQQPGIDFKQSFAPVARLESLRLLIAISARRRMVIRQIDAITAYLNSYLEEPVYMEVPETLTMILEEIVKRNKRNDIENKAMQMLKNLQDGDKVCMLERALYGLRQAGRQWNIHLDKILKKIGLQPTNADPCLYMSRQKGKLLLVLVYVDDILLASEDEKWTEDIIRKISNEIPIKDLGKAKNCLGIQITQNQDEIKLSQRGYIMNILERFGMEQSNPICTPADPNKKKEILKANQHEKKIERP